MVHTMEAMLVISNQTKSVDALSAQEVIDCAEENNGCDGGDICDAAIWAQTVRVRCFGHLKHYFMS